MRSTCPFPRGTPVAISKCWIFSLSQYSLNRWDVNAAPRSDTILYGFPKQTAWHSKQVTTSSIFVLRVGYNHTYLEKASTITKMWLYRFLVNSMGPTWSTWYVTSDLSPLSIGVRNPSCLQAFAFTRMHSTQLSTTRATLSFSFGM